jgi:hypothetical protein
MRQRKFFEKVDQDLDSLFIKNKKDQKPDFSFIKKELIGRLKIKKNE